MSSPSVGHSRCERARLITTRKPIKPLLTYRRSNASRAITSFRQKRGLSTIWPSKMTKSPVLSIWKTFESKTKRGSQKKRTLSLYRSTPRSLSSQRKVARLVGAWLPSLAGLSSPLNRAQSQGRLLLPRKQRLKSWLTRLLETLLTKRRSWISTKRNASVTL